MLIAPLEVLDDGLPLQAADQFLSNAAVQGVVDHTSANATPRNSVVLFEGRVASDLEAIFCRGSEWDSGAEHAFIFKVAFGFLRQTLQFFET